MNQFPLKNLRLQNFDYLRRMSRSRRTTVHIAEGQDNEPEEGTRVMSRRKSTRFSKDVNRARSLRLKSVDVKRYNQKALLSIQDWVNVRSFLMGLFNLKPTQTAQSELHPEPEATGQSNNYISSNTITIPNGFQQIRNIVNPRPTLKSALYIPHTSSIVTLDLHHLCIWRGGVRVSKFLTHPESNDTGESARKKSTGFLPGVADVACWIHIEKMRIYIVATIRLEIKVLDYNFHQLCIASSPKPILRYDFHFIETRLVLIELQPQHGLCSCQERTDMR